MSEIKIPSSFGRRQALPSPSRLVGRTRRSLRWASHPLRRRPRPGACRRATASRPHRARAPKRYSARFSRKRIAKARRHRVAIPAADRSTPRPAGCLRHRRRLTSATVAPSRRTQCRPRRPTSPSTSQDSPDNSRSYSRAFSAFIQPCRRRSTRLLAGRPDMCGSSESG